MDNYRKILLAQPLDVLGGAFVPLIELIPPVHQRVYRMGLWRFPTGAVASGRGVPARGNARNLELSVLRVCEQAPNQRSKFLVRQGCKLQQAGVQPLELALGQGVEVDAPNALLGTRALQPTQQNLRSTRIRDGALTQTAFDLRIRRGLALTARCAA